MTTNTTSKAIWKSGINALMIEFNTTCKPEMKLINKIINENVLFNWNLSLNFQKIFMTQVVLFS